MTNEVKKYISSIIAFFRENGVKIDPLPKIILSDATNNIIDPTITTGYYLANINTIKIFINNRHIKDILRSLFHELIHHSQNIQNDITIQYNTLDIENNIDLAHLEMDAYIRGNLLFRQWEKSLK
jgi:hypothetical protein